MMLLKDNTRIPAGEESLCLDIQKQINKARCVLVDLLDSPDHGEAMRPQEPPQIFRRQDDGTLSTGNYIGQFEFHQNGTVEQVTVSARGLKDGSAFQDEQGSFFLQTMLEACWDVPLLFLEGDVEKEPADHYSRLLAARLAAQLDRAWEKGRLRLYRTLPQRDSRVRGRLDIPREIRQGMGLPDGRMACQIREYTGDNDYNRLFLQACMEAERQYPALMLHMRKMLPDYNIAFQSLQAAVWDRMDPNTLLERTRKKITNPLYRDYETLWSISRAFLQRQGGCSPSGGRSSAPFVTGIFLDLSLLWERYLLKKVLPAGAESSYQSEKYILGGNMLVRPDFLFPQCHVVLDAKYKFSWGETLRGKKWTGSLHDDVYQLLTYMLELDCTHGGVIFPIDQTGLLTGDRPLSPKELQISIGASGRLWFWRFPFAVPSGGTDYSTFRQAMDREAGQLAQRIAELLS